MECSKLENVYFYGDAPIIGEYAFKDTSYVNGNYLKTNTTWSSIVNNASYSNITWIAMDAMPTIPTIEEPIAPTVTVTPTVTPVVTDVPAPINTATPDSNNTPKPDDTTVVKPKKTQKIKAITSKTFKVSKLKKKDLSFKLAGKASSGNKVTYQLMKSNKNIKSNAETGVVTIKKRSKKGTYKIKVKMAVDGNSQYNTYSTIKTITIKVKQ